MDNSYIGRIVDGRYEVISLVGVGGMSNVYKAIDLTTSNTVAIKFMKPELFENEELVRRFKNESKAISLLNHPNIIKVLDVNITPEEKYIVVEYIDGITLKEYIENRKVLSPQEAVAFTGTILSAMGYAHDNGIVHRDMKPQNVMLLRDGTIKIMDFGIARLSTANQHTVTDKAIGSVHYISPEQVRGKESDARSDIYSIGIMMYEMLTGVLPFVGDSAVSVAMKQVNENAKKPSEINEAIPTGLEQIITKAMAKQPADRYQSAAAMIDDLKRFRKDPAIIFPYGIEEEATQAVAVNEVAKTKTSSKVVRKKKTKSTGLFRGHLLRNLGILAVTVFLGSCLAIYLMFRNSGNPLLSNRETVSLPNYVGMTYEQVKSKSDNFKYDVEKVNNNDYPEGQIFQQSPRPPKTVKERSTIKLYISMGPATTKLRDLSGFSRSEAERYLQEADVNISIVAVEDKTVSLNHVIRTEPERGTTVTAGSTVTIYVSKGDPETTRTKVSVPSVVNVTLEEASKILAANKLTLGSYTQEYNGAPAGTVIRQTPDPGEKVYAGSRINLVLSQGEPPKPDKCDICGEEHKTKKHVCSVCGKVGHEGGECEGDKPTETPEPTPETPSHEHSYSGQTCGNPGTCSCGATIPASGLHTFGDNLEFCAVCGAKNPNYHRPTPPPEQPGGNEGGASAEENNG